MPQDWFGCLMILKHKEEDSNFSLNEFYLRLKTTVSSCDRTQCIFYCAFVHLELICTLSIGNKQGNSQQKL